MSDEWKLALKITWTKPQKPNGIIIYYKLHRLIIQTSVIFEQASYQIDTSRVNRSELVYTGMNMDFTDYDLIADSIYEYVVEVFTRTGSTLSLPCRIRTRQMLVSGLTETGRITEVTNEAVVLDLKAPLRLNGRVKNVFVELMSVSMLKKIELNVDSGVGVDYENDDYDKERIEIFFKSLMGIRIERLKSNENYEIKSIFCNMAGCVMSENALRFRTLDYDRIRKFNAKIVSPNSVDFDWEFSFGDKKSTEIVK